MRVAHLIDGLGIGGAEQIVASLAAFQSRCQHSVQVICLRNLGSNPVDVEPLTRAGVEIVELNKPPGVHFGTLRKLRDHLAKRSVEVLHTHNHLVHHYGVAAARWAHVPVVLNTAHGTNSLLMSASWSKALFWVFGLLGDKVACVDPTVRDALKDAFPFPASKLCVVQNGAELGGFLGLQRSPPGEVLTFGNVGRLDPVKGHAVLLQALAILRNEGRPVRLRVLGDGALRQDLQDLVAELGIASAVTFEGFSLDTHSFFGRIDVYVIPSLSEGLPLTLIEGMAAGLPIVATAVGGIPALIEQARCGWLCEAGNPDRLADAMREAMLTRDLAAIGARGRALAGSSFSTERMARDYEQLYRALLT